MIFKEQMINYGKADLFWAARQEINAGVAGMQVHGGFDAKA